MRNIILLSFLISFSSQATEEKKTKIIYEYKKYEKIDLGDFSIEGALSTPGDLTVKERDRKRFSRNLYHRYEFDNEIREDIWDLR